MSMGALEKTSVIWQTSQKKSPRKKKISDQRSLVPLPWPFLWCPYTPRAFCPTWCSAADARARKRSAGAQITPHRA